MKKSFFLVLFIIGIFLTGCTPDEPSNETTFDEIKVWLDSQYKDKTFTENIELLKSYETATFTWKSSNVDIVTADGEIILPEEDTAVNLICTISYDGKTEDYSLEVIILGSKNDLVIIRDWLNETFSSVDINNLVLPTSHPDYNYPIVWESSNPVIISSTVEVVKPYGANATVTLSCSVDISGDILKLSYDITVPKIVEGSEMVEIVNWLEKSYDGKLVNGDIELPTTHPTIPCDLVWLSFYDEIVDNDGKFTAPILDQEIEFLCSVSLADKKEDVFLSMTAIGCGTVMDVIKVWVKDQIGENVAYSFRFPTVYSKYNATFEWSSSNVEVITNNGEVTRPLNGDAVVTLTCIINYNGEIENYSFEVTVLELAARDKCSETKKWLDVTFLAFEKLSGDLDLPTTYGPMNAIIKWTSSFSNIIDSNGKFTQPISATNISLTAAITVDSYTLNVVYVYDVDGFIYTNKWEAVETFLDSINYSEIKTQYYQTYGKTTIDVINYGYLPFYDESNAPIEQKILEYTYGKQRTGIVRSSTQYIVVHDTGNNASGATAQAHWNYLNNLNNDPNSTSVSWHYTVDENGIIQNLPIDEVAWHAGDGSRAYGTTYFNSTYIATSITGGNMNGVGIETCVDAGSEYNNTMRHTAKLVAELLIQYNLGFDRVKQHNAFSGKDCPMAMRHAGRWDEFMFLVQLEYFAKNNLSGVTFEWKSLSPTIMNDNGEIISKSGAEANIEYQVTVTYDGVSKIYNFNSTLTALN